MNFKNVFIFSLIYISILSVKAAEEQFPSHVIRPNLIPSIRIPQEFDIQKMMEEKAIIFDQAQVLFIPSLTENDQHRICYSLRSLPTLERVSFINQMTKINYEKMDGYEYSQTINAFTTLKDQNKEPYIFYFNKITSSSTQPFDYENFIKILGTLSLVGLEQTINFMEEIMVSSKGKANPLILNILKDISDNEQRNFSEQVQRIVTKLPESYQICVLYALKNINDKDREDFIDQILNLDLSNFENDDFGSLIESLSYIKLEERETFLIHSQSIQEYFSKTLYSWIISGLKDIQAQERKEFIDQLKQIMKQDMEGREVYRLINILKTLPYESRKKLVQAVLNILSHIEERRGDLEGIIQTLKDCPEKEWNSIVENIIKLGSITSSKDYSLREILYNLKEISQYKRDFIVNNVMKFITSNKARSEIGHLLELFNKLPSDEISMFVEQGLYIVKEVPEINFSRFVYILQKIPINERNTFISYILRLSKILSKDNLIETLNILETVENEEKENFVNQIIHLIESIHITNQTYLVHSLKEVNSYNRENFIKALSHLKTDDMKNNDYFNLISLLQPYVSKDLESFVNNVLELDGNIITWRKRNYIIKCLNEIKFKDQKHFIQQALKLANGLAEKLFINMLHVLKSVPVQKLEMIVNHTLIFIEKGLENDPATIAHVLNQVSFDTFEEQMIQISRIICKGLILHDFEKIISVLKNRELENIKSIIDQVLRLREHNLDERDYVFVIESIKDSPIKHLGIIIDQTLRFGQNTSEKIGFSPIIKTINDIDLGNIETVVTQCLRLLKGDIKITYGNVSLLKKIKEIPIEKLEHIVTQFLRLPLENVTASTFQSITRSLTSLSKENIEKIISQTLRILPTSFSPENSSTIVGNLSSIEIEDLKSVVDHSLRLFTSQMNVHNRIEIFLAISEIPAEERENRIEETLSLIAQDQQNGLINLDNIFSRTFGYLIRQPLEDDQDIDVVSQEALINQRRTLLGLYTNMAIDPVTSNLIAQYLPITEESNKVFEENSSEMFQILKHLLIIEKNPQNQMKLINSYMGLSLLSDNEDAQSIQNLRSLGSNINLMVDSLIGTQTISLPRHGISSLQNYQNYELEGMPNTRQIFSLIYQILKYSNGISLKLEDFIKNWLATEYRSEDRWYDFKKTLQIKENSLGEALQNKDFITYFINLLNEKTEYFNHSSHPKIFFHLYKSYLDSYKNQMNPIIEALSMFMRGHNTNLNSLEEINRPACAEGAYIGIIKALQEIQSFSSLSNHLASLDIQNCGI